MSYDINSYYELLNITRNATQKEIKIAYRKKAHELHPDKNKDFDTTEQFQELNKAYEALCNIKEGQKRDEGYKDFGFGSFTVTVEYPDYLSEVDTEKYNTNVETLSCGCSDWQTNRKEYFKNDLRRLCKHIIAKFDVLEIYPIYNEDSFCKAKELKLPDYLMPFKNKILACRNDKQGIDLFWFHEPIFLNSFIIYISRHKKGINLFSKKYYKSIFFRLDCKKAYLSYNPYDHIDEKILFKYFLHNELKPFFQKRYYKCINFLELFNNNFIDEEKTEVYKAWENGYLLANQFEYNLPFFVYDDYLDNSLNKNKKSFGKNLKQQSSKDIKSACKQYKKYLKVRNETLLQYDTAHNLLKIYQSEISTRKFNSILKEMEFLVKVQNLNHNHWIIKDGGLVFGINYINSADTVHINIPKWYKISFFDYDTLSLKYEYRYGLLKMTNILWEKSKFTNLLEIIEKYLQTSEIRKKENKEQAQTQRAREREKELGGLECPKCASKNIHKKDKKQRKTFKVQRYQCMDCKKVFQVRIEEERNPTLF